MKKVVKKRFQEMILEVAADMPIYPDGYRSDTSWITQQIVIRYSEELEKMGINIPYFYFAEYNPVLTQLNNLHKEGKIDKHVMKGEAGSGHNWTLILWGKHARIFAAMRD